MKVSLVLAFVLLASGCCLQRVKEPPNTVAARTVVDKLKQELNLFASTPPNRPLVQAGKPLCTGADGKPIVTVIPTKAQLVLKVTVSNIYGANLSAKIPAGTIITVNPSFSGTYQTNGTQALTLDLDIQHDNSVSELTSDIDSLEKQIVFYMKLQKIYDNTDKAKAEEVAKVIKQKNVELNSAYSNLVTLVDNGIHIDYGSSDSEERPAALAGHDLAATLWSLRQNLLNVNHVQQPCVKPTQLKTQVDFEIVTDVKASLGIDIKIISAGVNSETKRDSVQSLIVTFDMAGGSSSMIAE